MVPNALFLSRRAGANGNMMRRYVIGGRTHAYLLTLRCQKLNSLLESLMDADEPLINTGVIATSPAQFSSLWAIREGLTEAVSKEGKAYKYDISVPLHKFQEVVDKTKNHLRERGLLREDAVKYVVGYGHVGDGQCDLWYD